MNILLLFKVIFVGFFHAGAFVVMLAFFMTYFPLPQLRWIRSWLVGYVALESRKTPKWAMKVWVRGVKVLRIIAVFVFLGVIVGYGYSLWLFMKEQLTIPENNFIPYYALAVLCPVPLAFYLVPWYWKKEIARKNSLVRL